MAAVVVLVLAALGGGGSVVITQTQQFLDFGAGVLALVSLTTAVLWGLTATDRVFLQPIHRILAQGVHRAAAVAGLGFLALHIWIKVTLAHTTVTAVVIPFADGAQPFLIGLGTIAMYLFVGVTATGALRSVFVSPQRARRWRILHASAYPAWGAALVHGLKSGRPPATYAVTAYALAIVGVAIALFLRRNAKAATKGAPTVPPPRTPRAEITRTKDSPALPIPEKPKQDPVGLVGQDGPMLPPPRRAEPDRPWNTELDRPWTSELDRPWSSELDRPWSSEADRPGGPEPERPWGAAGPPALGSGDAASRRSEPPQAPEPDRTQLLESVPNAESAPNAQYEVPWSTAPQQQVTESGLPPAAAQPTRGEPWMQGANESRMNGWPR